MWLPDEPCLPPDAIAPAVEAGSRPPSWEGAVLWDTDSAAFGPQAANHSILDLSVHPGIQLRLTTIF